MSKLSWNIRVLCVGFILTCMVAHGLAMESMPDKIEYYSVIIEDNELYQNNFSGINIRGSIPLAIKGCKIYSNGRAGIRIDRQAQVMVTGCSVFQNGRGGINVGEAARISIEGNRIYKNNRAGVRIWRSRKKETHLLEVEISNNRIYMNDEAGVRSMPQRESKVDLGIFDNKIYQNKKAGLRVENNTRLTARGNEIYDNGTAGIVSHVSATPPWLDIYQNKVSFNSGPGIHVVNGITGRIGIRNNWVFNNLASGILCGLWSGPTSKILNVEIINNTVVSNGSIGQGAGIRNDSKGKAIIMNNIVAYNYVTGIRTRRCKDYSHNLLFANGDVGNCCQDPNSAPYWIERTQLAGCPGRGKGDLICDPVFVDPDNYNFYLRDGSPAIDAGHVYNESSLPPSKGTTRNDMGATGGPYASPDEGKTSEAG